MSAAQPQILLVEDEPAQREILAYNLESEGFDVRRAENGEEAILLVAEALPDLIILDWMMPLLSGIEVCRQLKTREDTRNIPVIMLSARSEEVDTVRGLETGADDYVVKPYSMRELDTERHRVNRAANELKLGPTEYRLLVTLLERPGRVFSRDQLLDHVWGRDIYVDTRTVDVHIARLRKALTSHGGDDPIRTVRGAGYALG